MKRWGEKNRSNWVGVKLDGRKIIGKTELGRNFAPFCGREGWQVFSGFLYLTVTDVPGGGKCCKNVSEVGPTYQKLLYPRRKIYALYRSCDCSFMGFAFFSS